MVNCQTAADKTKELLEADTCRSGEEGIELDFTTNAVNQEQSQDEHVVNQKQEEDVKLQKGVKGFLKRLFGI